jgi:alkanesulfonate monooxygenase SsuD/methylene tetrahydromethanopterin reductase-like flavin-dependent oxidoreductase (luciferase family)
MAFAGAARTGISLNTATTDAALVIEAARAAEAAGFDAVWCYDHLSGTHLGGHGTLDAATMLGAVAIATEDVLVGPLVLNATVRHAVHIAVAAATLQNLSGGRARLGLGAGAASPSPFAAELEMFHLPQRPAAERRAHVAETIEFLRALWSGQESFSGRWASFDAVHGVSVPDPPVPVIVGANGPRMAELAGRHADGLNLHWWEDIPHLAGVARAAAAGRSGRTAPFEVSVEGPWEDDWLDPSSEVRRGLDDAGVDEVMVAWRAEHGLAAIERTARLLR